MATTEVNVGRVQGAGFFYSTYSSTSVAAGSVNKSTILSDLTIFPSDIVVDAVGRVYEVLSVEGDTIYLNYKSQLAGEKGDAGENSTIILNGVQTDDASFYAPTVSGSADGELLVSTGGEPTWTDNIKGVKFTREYSNTSDSVSVALTSYKLNVTAINHSSSTTIIPTYSFNYTVTITISVPEALKYDLQVKLSNITCKCSSNIYNAELRRVITMNSAGVVTNTTITSSIDEDSIMSTSGQFTSSISLGSTTVTIPAGSTSISVSFTTDTYSSNTTSPTIYSSHDEFTLINTETLVIYCGFQVPETISYSSISMQRMDGLTTITLVDQSDEVVASIDSDGKIECKELWVNGKQIT